MSAPLTYELDVGGKEFFVQHSFRNFTMLSTDSTVLVGECISNCKPVTDKSHKLRNNDAKATRMETSRASRTTSIG